MIPVWDSIDVIFVRTCNMNSTLGSVVPLAMFFLVCYSFVSHDILDYIDIETWKFELKFGDAWNNIITFCRVSLSNLLTRASCKCCQSGSIFSDCFPFEATPMFIVHHSSLTGKVRYKSDPEPGKRVSVSELENFMSWRCFCEEIILLQPLLSPAIAPAQ